MSLIERMRKQTAIYWAPISIDEQGDPTYDEPIEIACRWVDTQKNVTTPEGETFASTSTIYVDRDLVLHGRLMLGELDSETPSDPNDANSVEIMVKKNSPNIRNTEILHTVYA